MSEQTDAPSSTPREPEDERAVIDEQSTDTPSSDEPSAESGAGSRPRSEAGRASPPQGGGRGLGVLALLIAIIALGLASRPLWSPAPDEAPAAADLAQVEALGERLGRMDLRLDDVAGAIEPAQRTLKAEIDQQLDREVAALRQLVDELREAQDSDPGEYEALARRVGRLEGTQSSGEASLEARMGALEQRIEQRVAALQDQLGGLGADLETATEDREQRLALVHARALILKGRDDWMLNADAVSARAAWSGAAARLGPLETLPPELTDAMGRLVRSAERLEGPRTAERVAALERLAASVATWPEALQPDARATSPESAGPAESDGWRNRMAGAFNSLVTIESVDDAPPTPLEIDRARHRIAERLDAAALASARQDWSTVAALIQSAVDTMQAYLELDAPVVADVLDRLEELATAPESPVLPTAYDEVLAGMTSALERSE